MAEQIRRFRRGVPFAQREGVRPRAVVRCADHQYWPQWAGAAWLAVGLVALLTLTGCRASAGGAAPAEADATITGTVRGPEGAGSIEGRIVQVTNLETNERQRMSTNDSGAFAFRVKPGKYRVELALRDGESLVKQPDVMTVDRSNADAHADFIVGSVRVSRPRGPAYRVDDGLGSPVA